MGFKCLQCKTFMPQIYGWKYKSGKDKNQIAVCKKCYENSRTLKAHLNKI